VGGIGIDQDTIYVEQNAKFRLSHNRNTIVKKNTTSNPERDSSRFPPDSRERAPQIADFSPMRGCENRPKKIRWT
jgi:hypothetical protein